jgi:hypothetical protein
VIRLRECMYVCMWHRWYENVIVDSLNISRLASSSLRRINHNICTALPGREIGITIEGFMQPCASRSKTGLDAILFRKNV